MTAMVLEGNADDGYSPREIADGIDELNELANQGHDIGGVALMGVGTRIVEGDATVFGRRNRVVLPTGYIALSRSHPSVGDFSSPTYIGSDNYIG